MSCYRIVVILDSNSSRQQHDIKQFIISVLSLEKAYASLS